MLQIVCSKSKLVVLLVTLCTVAGCNDGAHESRVTVTDDSTRTTERVHSKANEESARGIARFTARVDFVEIAGRRNAAAIPVGVDPRWLVGVNILSVEQSDAHFDSPGKANLVIHSPTRTFLLDRDKLLGKVFRLTVCRGNEGYYHIEAEEVADIKEEAKMSPNRQ